MKADSGNSGSHIMAGRRATIGVSEGGTASVFGMSFLSKVVTNEKQKKSGNNGGPVALAPMIDFTKLNKPLQRVHCDDTVTAEESESETQSDGNEAGSPELEAGCDHSDLASLAPDPAPKPTALQKCNEYSSAFEESTQSFSDMERPRHTYGLAGLQPQLGMYSGATFNARHTSSRPDLMSQSHGGSSMRRSLSSADVNKDGSKLSGAMSDRLRNMLDNGMSSSNRSLSVRRAEDQPHDAMDRLAPNWSTRNATDPTKISMLGGVGVSNDLSAADVFCNIKRPNLGAVRVGISCGNLSNLIHVKPMVDDMSLDGGSTHSTTSRRRNRRNRYDAEGNPVRRRSMSCTKIILNNDTGSQQESETRRSSRNNLSLDTRSAHGALGPRANATWGDKPTTGVQKGLQTDDRLKKMVLGVSKNSVQEKVVIGGTESVAEEVTSKAMATQPKKKLQTKNSIEASDSDHSSEEKKMTASGKSRSSRRLAADEEQREKIPLRSTKSRSKDEGDLPDVPKLQVKTLMTESSAKERKAEEPKSSCTSSKEKKSKKEEKEDRKKASRTVSNEKISKNDSKEENNFPSTPKRLCSKASVSRSLSLTKSPGKAALPSIPRRSSTAERIPGVSRRKNSSSSKRDTEPPQVYSDELPLRRHNPAETWICGCGYELRNCCRFCGMCGQPQHWVCAECDFDQNLYEFRLCGGCAAPKNMRGDPKNMDSSSGDSASS